MVVLKTDASITLIHALVYFYRIPFHQQRPQLDCLLKDSKFYHSNSMQASFSDYVAYSDSLAYNIYAPYCILYRHP